jgi:hypothetical protein
MNKQSFDSEKFSAAGITVTTANPIYYNVIPESPKDWYLSFDQNNKEDVKGFQRWVQKNIKSDIIDFVSVTQNKDGSYTKYTGEAAVDGKMLGKTAEAWFKYGDQYLASFNPTPTLQTQPPQTTAPTAQPTPEQIAAARKKGLDWNKLSNKWEKIKSSGLWDAALGLLGLGKKPDEAPTEDKLKNPDKGMSKGAKIAIGVGAVVILGVIIYAATKKSK